MANSSPSGFPGPNGPWQIIRFGPGVVGRTTTVLVAFLVLLMVAAFAARDHIWVIVVILVLAAASVAAYIFKVFDYAERHPNHAVTEGGELVRIKELEQAARDPKIIDLSAQPVANTSPPIGITGPGE